MPTIFNQTFNALGNEAEFTKEMLGAGATQIRRANYATKGMYFQAFTSLSTGLERIGKLSLMLDHYIETGGQFPDFNYMKKEICHNLSLIYEKSKSVVERHTTSFKFLKGLDGGIHQNILTVLSDFAEADRYSNIDLLVGRKGGDDPVAIWFEKVDKVIFELCVPPSRKSKISRNARIIEELMGGFTSVFHTSESGSEITSVQEASYRTGFFEAVAHTVNYSCCKSFGTGLNSSRNCNSRPCILENRIFHFSMGSSRLSTTTTPTLKREKHGTKCD